MDSLRAAGATISRMFNRGARDTETTQQAPPQEVASLTDEEIASLPSTELVELNRLEAERVATLSETIGRTTALARPLVELVKNYVVDRVPRELLLRVRLNLNQRPANVQDGDQGQLTRVISRRQQTRPTVNSGIFN